ncbi:2OG-Fe(II) oxygenase [Polaribacter sargassicola]|uniref:2OG-Fe(II) oxygenase n=1 Tax=Polaribacter sargassicola TaxID=2836891 RepID=UPI001F1D0F5E|nr:2OG-Fe(II) oxygenase [Polaribacter sp. DS7-9]MCG1035825.1 2OG-Fe(II) oxygenase [Polaribacter sp. DS7-9]
MNRIEIADLLYDNLYKNKEKLKQQFVESSNKIGFFYLDNLLPKDIALLIYKSFPDVKETVERNSLREHKFTAFQMDKYNAILEEVIYSFQEPKIVDLVSKICDFKEISADKNLYAGGLSLMVKDNFLNPHLDNSHDKDRNKWRVLNLLYYVTPNWQQDFGGNLEIWPNGLKEKQTTIESKFNRLVVMATHQKSWHSVSKVTADNVRCCVSNYYFSEKALLPSDSFHVTTFRGRPKEKMKDIALQLDNKIRSAVRVLFKKGVRENPHQYKKK